MSSPTFKALAEYRRDIIERGGEPAYASFYQDYYDFSSTGGRGTRYRAEFRVIYNRDRPGNELNRFFRQTIGLGQRGLIPRLAARPGTVPIFRGFNDLHRGGFVKVFATSEYDFKKGYD